MTMGEGRGYATAKDILDPACLSLPLDRHRDVGSTWRPA